MEKIEQQMENGLHQLGQQMAATLMPAKPKPYIRDGKNQKIKIINRHCKPNATRYIISCACITACSVSYTNNSNVLNGY